jgi:hypothetical protein
MQIILSNVTAALLVLHAVFGCCWHHAHHCAEECGMAQTAERPDCHEGHSPGDCDSTAPTNHDGHHGSRECQGNPCSFVASISPNGNSFAQSFQASVLLLLDDRHPMIGAGSKQHFLSAGWLLPPVRLHLANQVMLI